MPRPNPPRKRPRRRPDAVERNTKAEVSLTKQTAQVKERSGPEPKSTNAKPQPKAAKPTKGGPPPRVRRIDEPFVPWAKRSYAILVACIAGAELIVGAAAFFTLTAPRPDFGLYLLGLSYNPLIVLAAALVAAPIAKFITKETRSLRFMESIMAGIFQYFIWLALFVALTFLVGGFGSVGHPYALIEGLIEQGARELTIVANNAGWELGKGLPKLLSLGRVRKIICTFPRGSTVFEELYRAGKIELEIVPQGTLAERMRAAGAGVPAFFTATGVGTKMAMGKQTQEFDGRNYVMERALPGDVGLVEAWEADRWGNLTFRESGRNFNPVIAMAAKLTIVQTQHIRELGAIVQHTACRMLDETDGKGGAAEQRGAG